MSRIRAFLHTAALPTTVVLVGLALSAIGAWQLQDHNQAEAQAVFQRTVQRTAREITHRFHLPLYGLNGIRGLYAASRQVESAEFRAYTEARDMALEFPGVRGLAFAQHVQHPQLDAFIAAQRADQAPSFTVWSLSHAVQDDLYVVRFIAPALGNSAALGLDLGSEPVRRAAVQQAVDSGQATLSGVVTLVQERLQGPGVLLLVPV